MGVSPISDFRAENSGSHGERRARARRKAEYQLKFELRAWGGVYDVLSEMWPGADVRGAKFLLAVRVSAYRGDELARARRSTRRGPKEHTAGQAKAAWSAAPHRGARLFRRRAALGGERGRCRCGDLRISNRCLVLHRKLHPDLILDKGPKARSLPAGRCRPTDRPDGGAVCRRAPAGKRARSHAQGAVRAGRARTAPERHRAHDAPARTRATTRARADTLDRIRLGILWRMLAG